MFIQRNLNLSFDFDLEVEGSTLITSNINAEGLHTEIIVTVIQYEKSGIKSGLGDLRKWETTTLINGPSMN